MIRCVVELVADLSGWSPLLGNTVEDVRLVFVVRQPAKDRRSVVETRCDTLEELRLVLQAELQRRRRGPRRGSHRRVVEALPLQSLPEIAAKEIA